MKHSKLFLFIIIFTTNTHAATYNFIAKEFFTLTGDPSPLDQITGDIAFHFESSGELTLDFLQMTIKNKQYTKFNTTYDFPSSSTFLNIAGGLEDNSVLQDVGEDDFFLSLNTASLVFKSFIYTTKEDDGSWVARNTNLTEASAIPSPPVLWLLVLGFLSLHRFSWKKPHTRT